MGKNTIPKEMLEQGEKLWKNVEKFLEEVDSMGDKESLNETMSSISRAWAFTEKYETAILSAYRDRNENCIKFSKELGKFGIEFSKDENHKRHQQLLSILKDNGFNCTDVEGSWIENFQTPLATERIEESVFVVNSHSDSDFKRKIIGLGKYFCQDAVLLKEPGKESPAYVIGTNTASYPGLGKRIDLGRFVGNVDAEFATKIGKSKKPFTFLENYNNIGRFLISKQSKIEGPLFNQFLKEMDEIDPIR